MAKNITGVVSWLKGWFFDKDEIISKENALQSQINNKASTSDLNTTNSNITNLQTDKADKTNGASQITDNNAYSNLGTSANATQSAINTAIDGKIQELKNIELYEVVSSLPSASANTVNKLYFVTKSGGSGEDNFNVYYTVYDGSSYNWEKIDDFDLQSLTIDWSSIVNKPTEFTPASHQHDVATTTANGFMSSNDKTVIDYSKAIKKYNISPSYTSSGDSVTFTGLNSVKDIVNGSIVFLSFEGIVSSISSKIVKVRINGSDCTLNIRDPINNIQRNVYAYEISDYYPVLVYRSGTSLIFLNPFYHTHSQYLTQHQDISGKVDVGDAVTSIELIPKTTDSTGAIKLYYGDEP